MVVTSSLHRQMTANISEPSPQKLAMNPHPRITVPPVRNMNSLKRRPLAPCPRTKNHKNIEKLVKYKNGIDVKTKRKLVPHFLCCTPGWPDLKRYEKRNREKQQHGSPDGGNIYPPLAHTHTIRTPASCHMTWDVLYQIPMPPLSG